MSIVRSDSGLALVILFQFAFLCLPGPSSAGTLGGEPASALPTSVGSSRIDDDHGDVSLTPAMKVLTGRQDGVRRAGKDSGSQQLLSTGACCDECTGTCALTQEDDCEPPLVWRGPDVPCNLQTCSAGGGPMYYPHPGTEAPAHGFTAIATGEVWAFFWGSDTAWESVIGMSVNGAPPEVYGLPNHVTWHGDALLLGFVNAGDNLEFILQTWGYEGPTYYWSTDPRDNSDGFMNHAYAARWCGDGVIPSGQFVAFEERPRDHPFQDLDYNDHEYVFQNAVARPIPELLGACCDFSGACTITSPASCVDPSVWHADWTTCSPNPCTGSAVPAPIDAGEPEFFGAVPNPFSGNAVLRFQTATTESVELCILDAGGRVVRSFANHVVQPGMHSFAWDGGTESPGGRITPGVYFARLRVGNRLRVRTIVCLR
jgi:hypothetical protein